MEISYTYNSYSMIVIFDTLETLLSPVIKVDKPSVRDNVIFSAKNVCTAKNLNVLLRNLNQETIVLNSFCLDHSHIVMLLSFLNATKKIVFSTYSTTHLDVPIKTIQKKLYQLAFHLHVSDCNIAIIGDNTHYTLN